MTLHSNRIETTRESASPLSRRSLLMAAAVMALPAWAATSAQPGTGVVEV